VERRSIGWCSASVGWTQKPVRNSFFFFYPGVGTAVQLGGVCFRNKNHVFVTITQTLFFLENRVATSGGFSRFRGTGNLPQLVKDRRSTNSVGIKSALRPQGW